MQALQHSRAALEFRPAQPVAGIPNGPAQIGTLRRPRLEAMLAQVDERRVALVVGPAGSGKSTLLAQYIPPAGTSVAWLETDLQANRPTALVSSGSGLRRRPRSIRLALEDLASSGAAPTTPTVLIVDDLHTLPGSPAGDIVADFVDAPPGHLRLVLASRRRPWFDLEGARAAGELLEIGPDELRFRAWEVERLFCDYYGEPLPPEDLAYLARRTEGWAAGLQLFHLATRGKPTEDRRRVLAELGTRAEAVRQYLVENVLQELAEPLQEFLLGSCVLGRLTGTLCDTLLGIEGSSRLLEELERRQVFTAELEPGIYRYHEVLRGHLESVLAERLGGSGVRRRYRWAGELLEWSGATTDALRAYVHAEDWSSIAELLGREGHHIAASCREDDWLDALPAGLLADDPWLMLARARRHLALGSLDTSLDLYGQAQRADNETAAQTARREREALRLWLDPAPWVPHNWMGLLRSATQRNPLVSAEKAAALARPEGRFVEGISYLLAGHFHRAFHLLSAAADMPDISPVLGGFARLLVATMSWLRDGHGERGLPEVSDELERLGVPWLDRLWRHLLACATLDDEATIAPFACPEVPEDDAWVLALTSLAGAFAGLAAGRVQPARFRDAAEGFVRVGAGVGEAWAVCGEALASAMTGAPDAEARALEAVAAARRAGLPGAEALPLAALAMVQPRQSDRRLAHARELSAQFGVPLPAAVTAAGPSPSDARPSSAPGVTPPVRVRCLGGFRLEVAGRWVDLGDARPRARAALRLLALHAGQPVHREAFLGALWPETDPHAAGRNLHVTISTLRRELRSVEAETGQLIIRDGDTYRLALPEGTEVDLWTFSTALSEGRKARARGDTTAAITAFSLAVESYGGELLPEDGPAEWVVLERERFGSEVAEASLALSELHLAAGSPVNAAEAAARGLRADRYRDGLWRALVAAHEAAGDPAAAAHARASYAAVLAELGVAAAP